MSVSRFMRLAVLSSLICLPLSACQPNVEAVPPTPEQSAELTRFHKNCEIVAQRQSGALPTLAAHRRTKPHFTCSEMVQTCQANFADEMCRGMMIVVAVENAYEKACRTSRKATFSSACKQLDPCNLKGFDTPECADVIARYR